MSITVSSSNPRIKDPCFFCGETSDRMISQNHVNCGYICDLCLIKSAQIKQVKFELTKEFNDKHIPILQEIFSQESQQVIMVDCVTFLLHLSKKLFGVPIFATKNLFDYLDDEDRCDEFVRLYTKLYRIINSN